MTERTMDDSTATITSEKEEAHWSSFRIAVASLQTQLQNNMLRGKSQDEECATPRFDFSGIVNNIGSSDCNSTKSSMMVSPLHEDTNASQTAASRVASEALSVAEQQLADVRLQLALAEAERDELEFELLQSKK
jgi:hypothetical protein